MNRDDLIGAAVLAGVYAVALVRYPGLRPSLAAWRTSREYRDRARVAGERAVRMLDAGFPQDLAYLADPVGDAFDATFRTARHAQAARRQYARRKAARRRDAHLNRIMRGEVRPVTRARFRSTRR